MLPSSLWLVGAGPGDPALLTLRGQELLEAADLVVHDATIHPALLERCREGARLMAVGQRTTEGQLAQDTSLELMIAEARAGHKVVRLMEGDPLFLAPGAQIIRDLTEAGVNCEVVPGVPMGLGATAYAGIGLTQPGLASSVLWLTERDRSGKPRTPEEWTALLKAADTLCIHLPVQAVKEVAVTILEGGHPPASPAALIIHGTRASQRTWSTNLGQLAAEHQPGVGQGLALLVLGDVVTMRERLRWFDRYPLFGRRILVPRPLSQARQTAHSVRLRAAEPIIWPLILIQDPPDPTLLHRAVRNLGTYDWVLLTSANGAERLIRAVTEASLDARAFGKARIAAIGPQTATALLPFGVKPDLIAREYVAESMAKDLISTGPLGRILLVRALDARDVLPAQLRAAGAEVDVVPAYRSVDCSHDGAEDLRGQVLGGRIDAVLLTSSSIAAAFARHFAEDWNQLRPSTVLASIGPITSRTLIEQGLVPTLEASVFTVEGLLDALAAYYQARFT